MTDSMSIIPLSAQIKNMYSASSRKVCARYDISPAELDIIDVLSSDGGYDTAAQIARLRCIKKANVSTAVDRLICRGLVEKSVDEKDKRLIHLKLTERAKSIASDIKKAQEEFTMGLKKIFTEGELKTLLELLDKLVSFGNYGEVTANG